MTWRQNMTPFCDLLLDGLLCVCLCVWRALLESGWRMLLDAQQALCWGRAVARPRECDVNSVARGRRCSRHAPPHSTAALVHHLSHIPTRKSEFYDAKDTEHGCMGKCWQKETGCCLWVPFLLYNNNNNNNVERYQGEPSQRLQIMPS